VETIKIVGAVLGILSGVVGIPVTVMTLFIARRTLKTQDTDAMAIAILAADRWQKERAKLLDDAKAAVTDRFQVILASYMPRELQEAKNDEIFRRLEAVETKIDNVPEATADRVMIRLRAERRT